MEKEDKLNLEDFIPSYPYLETHKNESSGQLSSSEPNMYYQYEDKYELG